MTTQRQRRAQAAVKSRAKRVEQGIRLDGVLDGPDAEHMQTLLRRGYGDSKIAVVRRALADAAEKIHERQ